MSNVDVAGGAHAELTVRVDDDRIEIGVGDGRTFLLPIGPRSLTDTEFARADPPPPDCLTNALGLVTDHLNDVLIAEPDLAEVSSVCFAGHHATSLGCVELGVGLDQAPARHRAGRADIDEMFRTLVVEPTSERRTNPGLDDDHVDTIVATCCVVLAIMRRLAMREVTFVLSDAGNAGEHVTGSGPGPAAVT